MAAKSAIHFDGSGTVFKEPKEVYYDGGWKPNHTVHSKYDENAPPAHFKICEYKVLRNDANQYTWHITTHVTHPYDVTKAAWTAKGEECEVKIEGQHLVVVKKGEQFGITMKLPKSADVDAKLIVEADQHTLYVTIPKIDATKAPDIINTAVMLDGFGRGPGGVITGKVYNHPSHPNSPELEMAGGK